MSLARLTATVEELPYALREQIIGYAESVRAAAPNIAKSAGIEASKAAIDELVFLAGIRKLYGLVASSFWALDNSTSLLALSDISAVRVGAQNYSRGSELHVSLKNLLEAIDTTLERQQIKELMRLSYEDLLLNLVQNGSQ